MSEKTRILVVDDDEGMRETLREVLNEEGYIAQSVGTGKQALSAVCEVFHNLALVDIKLPNMSGIELLQNLKKLSPDTAVVLITGYASMETSVEGLNLGAEAYLIKPLNIEELKMTIRRALERQKLILENRRLVEELKSEIAKKEALQAQLIQSARLSALEKLTAGISHEINNPLCAVLGHTQLLLRAVEDSSLQIDMKDALRTMERASKRIAGILENLDLYCRPSTGRLQLVEVNRTIEKTLSLIQAESDILNVKIEKKLRTSLPKIMANENALMHVFMHLMRNARDAMPNGGTLRISTSVRQKDGCIRVVFQDTGEGIAREDLEYVFEPFFTTRDPGRGTGLGLSIAYQIVKEHGGGIRIRSERGNGTTVTVTFPLPEERKRGAQDVEAQGGQT